MKVTLTLVLFVIGGASLGSAILSPEAARPFSIMGGVLWACAYFSFLAGNFNKKSPLPLRSGKLKYSEKPRTYKLVYGFMAFLGIFFLLVFIALNIYG